MTMSTEEKLDRLEINYDYLKEENKNLKDDLLSYIRREEEYREKIETLKIENADLMWERDWLKIAVQNIHDEIVAQDKEYKSLGNMNLKLLEKNKNLKDSLEFWKKEEEKRRLENKTYSDEYKTLKLIIETNENQIKNDLKERDELREEVKKRKMVAEENGTHYDMLEEENEKLKSDLEKFNDAYKKYWDYEKQELADSLYDANREIEKLKSELKIYDREYYDKE